MKKTLITFLIFSSLNIFAEEVTSEQDGSLKLNEKSQLGERQATGEDTIKGVSQVATESKTSEAKPEETKPQEIKKEEIKVEEVKVGEIILDQHSNVIKDSLIEKFLKNQAYVQIYVGRLDSKWSKLNSSLKDGSDFLGFRISRQINDNFETGVGMEFMQAKGEDFTPVSNRAIHFKIFTDYQKPIWTHSKFYYLASMALSYGDYNVRKTTSSDSSSITYQKIADGSLFGLAPGFGLRYKLGHFVNFDIASEYQYYVGSKQKNMSGIGYLFRLGLPW